MELRQGKACCEAERTDDTRRPADQIRCRAGKGVLFFLPGGYIERLHHTDFDAQLGPPLC
jgi:hypothetical protein